MSNETPQAIAEAVGAMRTYMEKDGKYFAISTVRCRFGRWPGGCLYETMVFNADRPYGSLKRVHKFSDGWEYGDRDSLPLAMHQRASETLIEKGYSFAGFERQNWQEWQRS
ncbi:MAG TPA: hypothetical protein VI968_04220 [archaeon]|nr:hypothetical protein [archaeon]